MDKMDKLTRRVAALEADAVILRLAVRATFQVSLAPPARTLALGRRWRDAARIELPKHPRSDLASMTGASNCSAMRRLPLCLRSSFPVGADGSSLLRTSRLVGSDMGLRSHMLLRREVGCQQYDAMPARQLDQRGHFFAAGHGAALRPVGDGLPGDATGGSDPAPRNAGLLKSINCICCGHGRKR